MTPEYKYVRVSLLLLFNIKLATAVDFQRGPVHSPEPSRWHQPRVVEEPAETRPREGSIASVRRICAAIRRQIQVTMVFVLCHLILVFVFFWKPWTQKDPNSFEPTFL